MFGFGKKKKENTCCSCSCGAQETAVTNECCGEKVEGICCIKVLGAGCSACHKQYETMQKAIKVTGLDVEAEYITDMEKIMEYGVMSMPAIVINEKVVSTGKVLNEKECIKLLGGVI